VGGPRLHEPLVSASGKGPGRRLGRRSRRQSRSVPPDSTAHSPGGSISSSGKHDIGGFADDPWSGIFIPVAATRGGGLTTEAAPRRAAGRSTEMCKIALPKDSRIVLDDCDG